MKQLTKELTFFVFFFFINLQIFHSQNIPERKDKFSICKKILLNKNTINIVKAIFIVTQLGK